MESFTTKGLPAGRRLAFWNEIASDTFAAMEVRPRDSERFYGSLSRERLGSLTVMNVLSAAVRIQHTREHIARVTAPSYLLLAPLQHEMELTAEGCAPIRLGAGEFCLIDHARTYELRHGDSMRTLCVDLPRRRFEELLPQAQSVVGRRMRPDCAATRLLAAMLGSLGTEISAPGGTGLSATFGDGLLSLVASTYSGGAEPLPVRGTEARAQRYRAYIDQRLADPELKPAEVATHFGVSERYLRTVLASGEESFSAYLLRRRLERCAQLLHEAGWAHRTITEIAFHSGFSNATHFGQAFKARFGCTPREFRARHEVLSEA